MPGLDCADFGEVVRFTSELVAIDTTNTGGPGTVGERKAAEYVAEKLTRAGADPELIESEPNRTSVVLRFAGTSTLVGADTADAGGNGIVVHGHLDAVPADPAEWSVDPFGGLIRDGQVWGRGAIDMKGTCAGMLTVARRWLATGQRPRRDVVFAWLADEEAGGTLGAQWLCRHRPELFTGCSVAIGEVGGFSIPLGRASLYPIMTAERGHATLTVTTRGATGHGSIRTSDNAISKLALAVSALADYQLPAIASASTTGFLAVVGKLWGTDLLALPLDTAVRALGPLGELIAPSLRHSVVPTMLHAGYAANVIPGLAEAVFDCRVLPGHFAAFEQRVAEILGPGLDHTINVLSTGSEVSFDGDVVAGIRDSLRMFDPAAVPLPYMVSASTDGVHFAAMGMRAYGFSPLRLPMGFRYGSMFHGRDERVPIDGLEFGVDVLDHFLRTV